MPGVQDELARLAALPAHRLRIEWRRQFRSEPPAALSRNLLLRAITYKVQERADGGLSQAVKRTLRNLVAQITAEGADGAPSAWCRRSSQVCVWCASGGDGRIAYSYSRTASSTRVSAIAR